MIKVPEQIQRDLEDVMSSFKAPIRYAFAYGSGVFQQKGYTNEVRSVSALRSFHRRCYFGTLC